MFRIFSSLAFCFLVLFSVRSVISAQGIGSLLSGSSKAPAAAAAATLPPDPLKREAPRSAVYQFLEACHHNKFTLAAQYLDLRKVRAGQGPILARELADLLDRNPRFEVDTLSNNPAGNTDDGLSSNLETLATWDLNAQTVSLQLERLTINGRQLWQVSAASVALIGDLSSQTGERGIEKSLPAPLVNIKLIGTSLYIWIALILLALILGFLSRLISRIVIAILMPLTRRYAKSFHTQRLESLTEPLRLILSVIVFRAGIEIIAPSALLRLYLLKLLALLFVIGAASLVMRLVDVISDTVISRLDPASYSLSYSAFPLAVRAVKVCILCIAILITLSQWGYNTNTILAGVGVGGLAVALAAQRTIENLFGGISLITDRPVLVGDFCQFSGQVGTVEAIGLRSTRIRTLDRTVVSIPNAQFSTMTLENYSKRDRMWFHPTLRLRRETPPEKISAMMEAITKILQSHEKVDAAGVPLRFTKINDQSLDLDIFAYVLTPDFNEYLKVQSELLLKFLKAGADLDVRFALPIQESLSAPEPTVRPEVRPPLQA